MADKLPLIKTLRLQSRTERQTAKPRRLVPGTAKNRVAPMSTVAKKQTQTAHTQVARARATCQRATGRIAPPKMATEDKRPRWQLTYKSATGTAAQPRRFPNNRLPPLSNNADKACLRRGATRLPLAPTKTANTRAGIREPTITKRNVQLSSVDNNSRLEAGESSYRTPLQKQLADCHTQLKEYEELKQAVSTLIGSPEDISPNRLATSLLSTWGEQQTEISSLKTKLGDVAWERDHAKNTVSDLVAVAKEVSEEESIFPEDAAKQLRDAWTKKEEDHDDVTTTWEVTCLRLTRDNEIMQAKLQDHKILESSVKQTLGAGDDLGLNDLTSDLTRKWSDLESRNKHLEINAKGREDELAALKEVYNTPVKKTKNKWRWLKKRSTKVDPLQLETQQERESRFLSQIVSQTTTIRSLEKDKSILESQLGDLKRANETFGNLLRNARKDRSALMNQRDELEQKLKRVGYESEQYSAQIKRLNELLVSMAANAKTPHSATKDLQTTKDHTVIATLAGIDCDELDFLDLRNFNSSASSTDKINLQKIGKGSYGTVVLARLEGVSTPVAIKIPIIPDDYTPEQAAQEKRFNLSWTRKEALAGVLLSGIEYFPEMFGYIDIQGEVCIATEFIGDKTTGKHYPLIDATCKTDPEPKVPAWNMVAIVEDISRGVMAIHDLDFLHNDIKEDNILLEFRGCRWHGVIIDLGLVTTMAYPHRTHIPSSLKEARRQKRDDFSHLAPEIILQEKPGSVAADIYSVGMLISQIAEFINDDDLKSVAEQCTVDDPYLRPRAMDDILPKVIEIKEKMQGGGNPAPLKRNNTFILNNNP